MTLNKLIILIFFWLTTPRLRKRNGCLTPGLKRIVPRIQDGMEAEASCINIAIRLRD